MSSKFNKIFRTLPPEAQQSIVETHLSRLLDLVPKEKSKKVIAAATRLDAKYKQAPKLDLRTKRKQVTDLLDELARDGKTSFIKERSNRDELLSEIVHSLVSWLNDIWSVVYEFKIHFWNAHTCLLFVADCLAQLSESAAVGGCKCSVMNLPIDYTLRDKHGKVIKHFSVTGPQNIDRILLWIWRDLFVSLFATGSERDRGRAPEYLEDIQSVLGVVALERLLYGGRPIDEDEEDDDDEDEDDYEDTIGDHSCGDEDSEYDSDESDERCPCNLHASYWTEGLNRARVPLRECVEQHLLKFFRKTPSLRIYNTLRAITPGGFTTDDEISTILADIAGDSPDNLVAALDIYIAHNDYAKIALLLDSHMYLLRPRDMVTLQCAVALLDDSQHHSRALSILESELEDSLRCIHAAILSCFSHIEEECNKCELAEILKLKGGGARKDRIEQWTDQVLSTPGPMHPMAVAAMMMGFPMLPGIDGGDDSDVLNYVDLDKDDPDLDDLREDYRPDLKARFDGWVHLGQEMKGGPAILAKVYAKAIEMMPYIRGTDIVNEMTNRLRERPTKIHVVEALANITTFAKMQRKKLALARNDKKRSAPNAAGGQGKSTTAPHAKPPATNISSASGSASTTQQPPPPPPPHTYSFSFGLPAQFPIPFSTFPSVPGGMEDVD